MRFYLLFPAIFLLLQNGFGQADKMIRGDEFSSGKFPAADHLIASDSSGFYFVSLSEKNENGSPAFIIQKFSSGDGKKLFSKTYALPAGCVCQVLAAVVTRSKIIVHISVFSRDRKEAIRKYIFHSSNGNESVAMQVIESSEPEFQGDNEINFLIQYSPDMSKMMILKEVIMNTNREIRSVKMFDTSSETLLWEQKLNQGSEFAVPPIGTEIQDRFNSVVDNSGKFSYLYYTVNEETGIQIISGKFADNKNLVISSASVTISNPFLEVLNGELYCSGEVTEGYRKFKMYEDKGAKMGFFLMRIDAGKGKISKCSYDYFNEELIRKLNYSDKNPHYSYEGVKSFYYSNKTYKYFKSVVLNGEIYVIRYHGFDWTVDNEFSDRRFVGAKEIIVFKYRNTELQWMRIVPRNTISTDRGGIADRSGIEALAGKSLHLVYFDRSSNLAKFPDPLTYNPKKYNRAKGASSRLVHLTISAEGKLSREVMAKGKPYFIYSQSNKTPQIPNKMACSFGIKKARLIALFSIPE